MKKFLHNLFVIIFFQFVLSLSAFSQSCAFPDGNALAFDGVDDKVTVSNNSTLSLSSFTIEAWVFVDNSVTLSSTRLGVATKVQWAGSDLGYGLDIEYGKPRIFSGQSWSAWGGAESSTNITKGAWVHLAGTYDGSTYKLYVNGVLDKQQSGNAGVQNNTQPLVIGSWPLESKYFKGKIDEVRVWNIVRTATEINNNKSLSLIGTESGLVAYYRFNQGSPAGNNSAITTLTNTVSSSTNTGSLSGFALSGSTSNWVGSAGDAISGPSEVTLGNTISLTYPVTGGTWSSSNTSVATVSSTGVVTGQASGTAQISYTHSGSCVNSTVITVNATPSLSSSGTLTAFQTCAGTASSSQTFTLTGQNLTGNVSVAALTGFEYSTNNSSYSSTLTITPSAGSVSQTVYVRMSSSASGSPAGNISISSTGVTTLTIAASGTATTPPNAGTLSGTQAICVAGISQLTTSGSTGGTWTTSASGVATVSSSGLVTGVAAGASTITYTVAGSGGCANATSTILEIGRAHV